MKLYATTTSERASKGQGGNEYLDINITGEENIPLWKIRVDKKGWYNLTIHNLVNTRKSYKYDCIYDDEIKGKRQKGDIWDSMEKQFPKGFIK
jgi:hypothetical protein